MDSVETGRSPFFSQLQKEGQRAADLVFTDLDTTSTTSNIEPGLFRTSQINTLYGTLPLFVLSHIHRGARICLGDIGPASNRHDHLVDHPFNRARGTPGYSLVPSCPKEFPGCQRCGNSLD